MSPRPTAGFFRMAIMFAVAIGLSLSVSLAPALQGEGALAASSTPVYSAKHGMRNHGHAKRHGMKRHHAKRHANKRHHTKRNHGYKKPHHLHGKRHVNRGKRDNGYYLGGNFNRYNRVHRHNHRHGYRDHRRRSGVYLSGNFRKSHRAYRPKRHGGAYSNHYNQVLENGAYSGVTANVYINDGHSSVGVYDTTRETIINNEPVDAGTKIVTRRPVQPCPSHHNCGYRVYSDGTGPRIITPGLNDKQVGVPFDGIHGPAIITFGH